MSETQVLQDQDAGKSAKRKRNTIEDSLMKGEQVVCRGHIHAGIYWQAVAVFGLALLMGLVAVQLGMLLALSAILMFAYATLKKEILLLVLTNQRVFVRYGILQVDVVDIRFSKIESLELERMVPGYLMGYANVVIMGTGQRYITIPYVGNAGEFRQAYNRLTLEREGKAEE